MLHSEPQPQEVRRPRQALADDEMASVKPLKKTPCQTPLHRQDPCRQSGMLSCLNYSRAAIPSRPFRRLCLILSVSVCLSLSLSLCVCLSVCLSVRPSVRPSVGRSVGRSVCLSVCLSVPVCLCVCVFVFVSLSVPLCPCLRIGGCACAPPLAPLCASVSLPLRQIGLRAV